MEAWPSNLTKAFDRVQWPFLRAIMLKMGFCTDWVNLVMKCVESTSFSFIINREPRGFVKPSRGIRQGDPISPYLFLFCAEGLFYLIQDVAYRNSIKGYHICNEAPSLSHLLFTYDSIIFCGANKEEEHAIKGILDQYETTSGQKVNFSKSNVLFGKGIPP